MSHVGLSIAAFQGCLAEEKKSCGSAFNLFDRSFIMLNCTFCHKGLMQLLKFNQSASHVKRFLFVFRSGNFSAW